MRVGGRSTIHVNVRVIAATNRDLEQLMKERKFREDLYYRLNIFPIKCPSLRERREDIPLLVDFFIKKYSVKMGKQVSGISRKMMDKLQEYHWPGNMRELITFLKRAGILLESPITGEKLKNLIYGKPYDKAGVVQDNTTELIWNNLKSGKSFWEVVKVPFLKRDLNRKQAKAVVSRALIETSGNYKETLKLLNIDNTEYSKFMKFLYRNELN